MKSTLTKEKSAFEKEKKMRDQKCSILVDGVVYVPEQVVTMAENYNIVRTYSAGVFAGEVESQSENGKKVVLRNARRIWKWHGAASLSQLAMEGTKKPNDCKFPCEVDTITLTEAIEIIPCTEQAQKSIKGVPVCAQ